ncbi:MAG TPA: M28 family peptidase [Citricoccus sp.]
MNLRRLPDAVLVLMAAAAILLVATLGLLVFLSGGTRGLRTSDIGAQSPAQSRTAYDHLERFQALAEEHGDRAAGTPGYEAAAQYVEAQLAAAGYETTRHYFTVQTRHGQFETFSVLAETAGGDEDNVIMLGAHLDGVPGSPAINDNASGAAALLETARRLSDEPEPLAHTVRLAWWGAEEYRGYPGSSHYVEELEDEDETETIAAYLNFDMVASPNHVIALYDAHDTDTRLDVPDGSTGVMAVLTDYFDARGEPWVTTGWDYESDQVAFAEADIPVGGLFTGSDERKSSREARLFGGEAGQPRDPNYHRPGDDLGNVDPATLELTTDAMFHAAATLGQDITSLQDDD